MSTKVKSTKPRKSTRKPKVSEGGSVPVLTLQQRTGGAMAVGSENVASLPEFPQPYNISSGGAVKVKKSKKPIDPNKPKRKLSAYNLFVKTEMPKLKNVAPKDRMKKLGEMWKESKK